MTHVPKTPEEMTPEWLTEALHESGALATSARVTGCEFDEIGIGRGYVGVTLRVKLDYEPAAAGPASLVAKLPTVLEIAQESDRALVAFIYSTEINFYRKLAAECPARIPVHYWSGSDPDAGRYCLLIEDMGNLRMVAQVKSCSVEDANLAVSTLAKIHARWWQDERLTGQQWLLNSQGSGQLFQGLYAQGWDHFWAEHGDVLPPEYEAAGRALSGRFAELVEEGSRSAWTLVHGDYRLENFLFDDAHADPLVVLDWQLISWGSGLRDLSYFIAQNLTTELRREHESDLLKRYHETLRAHDVNGYTFDQLIRDYRIGLLLATVIPVNGARMLAEQKEQGFDYLDAEQRELIEGALEGGKALMREMATRNVSAILDNAAHELI
ncbi:MAG: phosphotransferase [Gammaproteobacteria bacterium]|nr:phosphotransferase [Gammaproteobacteria bacterium]